MTVYAMLNGNTVENIIVADNKEDCETALRCVLVEIVDGEPATVGWLYDSDTKCFVAPTEDTPQ